MTRYNTYRMREGDPSVFGDFRCHIFGQEQIHTIESKPDDSPDSPLDILGVPMRRKDPSIHISGLDEYGDFDHGGFVRELGWFSVRAADGGKVNTNEKPHGVAIVMNIYHPNYNAPHMSQWSESSRFVTMNGIRAAFGGYRAFSPEDVAARIDELREKASGEKAMFPIRSDRDHVRAIRRILEGSVMSNGLERVGRWSYRLARGAS